MSEIKKLLDEELKSVKGFRNSFQQITFDLGNVEMQLSALKERKEEILQSVRDLRKEEDDYLAVLQEKYGGGRLDLETGEITPIEDERAPQDPASETTSASSL